MFLSNPRKSLVLFALAALLLPACGSSRPTSNTRAPAAATKTGRSPFPTKEPTVYQGDLIVSNGASEEQYFVARKDDQWRFDVYRDGGPATTQLRSDKVYTIDHAKKAYAVETLADLEDFDTSYLNMLSWQFFRGANYIDFEELGREGSLVRYKARTLKDSKSEVYVTVDESTGMMVRQEITSQKERNEQGSPVKYVFEVRNLKLDVDDSLFDVPAGFHRVGHIEPLPRTDINQ